MTVFYEGKQVYEHIFGGWCQNPLPVLPGHTSNLSSQPPCSSRGCETDQTLGKDVSGRE